MANTVSMAPAPPVRKAELAGDVDLLREGVRALGLDGISSQVSRLCQTLDEEVERFRSRKLETDYPDLWLDATFVQVREGGRVVGQAVVIAIGANADGQGASWQRCRIHLLRNLLALVPKSTAEMVAATVRTAFAQPDPSGAREQWRKVAHGRRIRDIECTAEVHLELAEDAVLEGRQVPRRAAPHHLPDGNLRRLRGAKRGERLVRRDEVQATVVAPRAAQRQAPVRRGHLPPVDAPDRAPEAAGGRGRDGALGVPSLGRHRGWRYR